MKRWMSWMVLVGMMALLSACDGGAAEVQDDAQELAADLCRGGTARDLLPAPVRRPGVRA